MDEQIISLNKWLELSEDEIRGRVNDGSLASSFSRDFNYVMGDIVCVNCNEYKRKLKLFKEKIRAMSKCDYEIKAKYNGLYGYNNGDLTNKKAEELALKHPRGYDLFSKLPKEIEDNLKEVERQVKEKEAKAKKEQEEKEEKEAKEAQKKSIIELMKIDEEANKQARKKQLESKSLEWLKRKAKSIEVEGKNKKELVSEIIKKEYNLKK